MTKAIIVFGYIFLYYGVGGLLALSFSGKFHNKAKVTNVWIGMMFAGAFALLITRGVSEKPLYKSYCQDAIEDAKLEKQDDK